MADLPISDVLLKRLQARADQLDISLEMLLEAVLDAPVPQVNTQPILEQIAEGALTIDEHQMIIWVNDAAASLFGYERDELIGMSLTHLLLDEDHALHADHVHSFKQESVTSRYMEDREPVRALHRDGTVIYVEISLLSHDDTYSAIIRDATTKVNAVQSLAENEARLRLLTEYASDLIGLHDVDGKLLHVSASCERLLGYAESDLIGSDLFTFLHPDDVHIMREAYQTLLVRQKGSSPVSYRFRHRSGEYIFFETSGQPIHDENGQIQFLVTYTRDITTRRRVQEELRDERDLLKSIMDASPTGITVVDPDGNIIFTNQRTEEIYGAPTDEIKDRTYDDVQWKHTDYDGNPWPDEKQPFVRVMQTGQPVWDVRHAIEWPDGSRVYLAINGVPIFDDDGNITRVVFSVEDYTSRKLQQDELAAALERERQLNQMKSAFISLVTHEFRTPMAVIMSSTGIMRKKFEKMTSEQVIHRLKRIETQVSRLDQIIEDVTFINRADVTGLQIDPVQIGLRSFIDELLEDLRVALPSVPETVIVAESEEDTIWSDVSLMQQIFINLLSNALKYTPDDGQVMLRYKLSEDTLVVDVEDTGIGIPLKDQKKLFSRFYRASNTGKISGTGLGLSIVDRAVAALGGNITFTSQEGVGTCFTLILPRRVKKIDVNDLAADKD